MNQLAIEFPKRIEPTPGSQADKLLHAMYRGERLTVAKALNEYGCYALSQRIGELKRLGWKIESRRADRGAYKIYWIEIIELEPVPFAGHI